MPRPTVKNLQDFLGVDEQLAREMRALLLAAEGDPDGADRALEYVDRVIDASGIEAIRGDYWVDRYYGEIVGLYVNTGDTYSGTVVYDTEKGRFDVTTWGDWVEKNERRYRIS